MRHRPVLAALLALSPLVACAPGNCDPNQADFFSGIAGEASGCYAARDRQLRTNMDAARANLETERARAFQARLDAGSARREQDQAAASLAQMARQNAALRARLATAASRDGADRASIARQQAELDALERDRAAASRRGPDPTQLQELQRRQRALMGTPD